MLSDEMLEEIIEVIPQIDTREKLTFKTNTITKTTTITITTTVIIKIIIKR